MPKQTFFNLDDAKRQAILDAALDEFSNHSYNEASINTIVEKSNISKGSLYQYFADKKDIYLYLIELAGEIKLKHLQQFQSTISFDDFFEGFAALIIHGVEFSLANPLHSKLLGSVLNGPLIDERLVKMKQMNAAFMYGLLQSAMDKKKIRSDVDIDLLVFFLNALTTDFARYISGKAKINNIGELYQPQNTELIKNLDIAAEVENLMKLIKSGIVNA